MNNIDILEEYLDKQDRKYVSEYRLMILNAIETLIAENKELKEKNKRQQENLKIANKKIAAQRGQLMMLNKAYIPKSKVEETIQIMNTNILNAEKFDCDYIGQCRFAKYVLQSLLGKE